MNKRNERGLGAEAAVERRWDVRAEQCDRLPIQLPGHGEPSGQRTFGKSRQPEIGLAVGKAAGDRFELSTKDL